MNLLTRNFLTKASFKRICDWTSCIYNEVGFSNVRYHTCLNNSNKTLLKELKCKKTEYGQIVSLSYLSSLYLNLGYKLKNLKNFNWKNIPIITNPKFRKIGYLWYNTFEEVNFEEYFTLFNLPDTFFSRFKVIELHVWMLLHVLPQSGRHWELIRYSLIVAMWEDTENRAKIVNDFNKNFRKNMRNLYEDFKVSLILYDYGYSQNDMSLADAIWNSLFKRKDIDPRYLEVLVLFIRSQMHHLNSLNFEDTEKVNTEGKIWFSVKPYYNEVFKKADVLP